MRRTQGILAQLTLLAVCPAAVIVLGTFAAIGQLNTLRSVPHAGTILNAFMQIEVGTLAAALLLSAALVAYVARSLVTRTNEVFRAFLQIFELASRGSMWRLRASRTAI